MWRLQMMFASLTGYLGGKDLFSLADRPSFLDARAFAYLSILFSLPICCDNDVFAVIQSNRSLVDYCVRVQERYQLWDNKKCFLVGLRAREHPESGLSSCKLFRRSSLPMDESDEVFASQDPDAKGDKKEATSLSISSWLKTHGAPWFFGLVTVGSFVGFVAAGNSPLQLLMRPSKEDEEDAESADDEELL
eukprot:GHVS01027974.1.p1 GENE.GHVS01027974.1~~GHVS01027974.1.p1  ORF type:complete len:191 (-),score=23.01 GHVS01027974.1:152-724(-)